MIVVNYLRHVLILASQKKEIRRFFKFCLVGLSGVFVNTGLLWLLTEVVGWFYLISAVFSIETSVVSNFILNELWTFRDRRVGLVKATLVRALKFNLVSMGGIAINTTVLFTLTDVFEMYYLVSNLFGIATAMMWNFGMNSLWTWRKSHIQKSPATTR